MGLGNIHIAVEAESAQMVSWGWGAEQFPRSRGVGVGIRKWVFFRVSYESIRGPIGYLRNVRQEANVRSTFSIARIRPPTFRGDITACVFPNIYIRLSPDLITIRRFPEIIGGWEPSRANAGDR